MYPSSNIIRTTKRRRNIWVGHVARVGKNKAYRVLVGKPDGKRPIGSHRYIWQDNIEVDLKQHMRTWNKFICLKIVTSSGLLCIRKWNFGLHEIRGI
jgi:hypothetical protein